MHEKAKDAFAQENKSIPDERVDNERNKSTQGIRIRSKEVITNTNKRNQHVYKTVPGTSKLQHHIKRNKERKKGK